MNTNRR